MRCFVVVSMLAAAGLAGVPEAPAAGSPLTHSTDFARVAPARWVAEGWRVSKPDPGAVVTRVEDVVAFVVTTPHTAMSWTLTTEPVWTDPFGTLALSYFVEGAPADGAVPPIELFDGSTGPITPGATNRENPLASGGRHACGTLAPGLQVELVDLAAVENLERVAEITITVRSGAEPVAVRLNQMAFLAGPPPEPHGTLPAFTEAGDAAPPFTPLSLPETRVASLDALAEAMGMAPEALPRGDVVVEGLPFHVGDAVALTPMLPRGNVVLEAGVGGESLALLCAVRLWGSGAGWYSPGSSIPRTRADGAHQFQVAVQYSDGSIEAAIPRRAGEGAVGLDRGIGVYQVPLAPEKTVTQVVGVEAMSYGQVGVLAASVLPQPDQGGRAAGVAEEGPPERKDASDGAGAALEPEWLVLEAADLRLAVDREGMVRVLEGGAGRQPLIAAPFPLITLRGPDGAPYPLTAVEATASPERDHLALAWTAGDGAYRIEVSLAIREEGGLACTAALRNLGDTPWRPRVDFPDLQRVRPRPGGLSTYLLGTRSALHDSAPVSVSEVYGGRFPLQFMDVYDPANGGLACFVQDDTLTRKWFSFTQDASGTATMSISYRNLELAPGAQWEVPSTVLLPHEGDWRAPFQQYKAWVADAFPRTRANPLKDVFYCRRDYPLGGTSYLYDPGKPGYSFEKLISESTWAFGGADMIDISGWAYNEDVGRVGTYLENDLGGLEALAAGIDGAGAKDIQVGLYFEGYLLDKRAATAEEGLADWQLHRAGDEPAWWPGEMEFFCCPGAEGWQAKLASDIAEVARVTGADAVYLDQLGICDTGKECHAPDQGHPVPSNPIVEEIALLKRVREELDRVNPECAIYIEHLPCDAMTPYIDGAFNLGMKHTRHALGPTKLPLHRYLTPEAPVFEMVAHGIRPIPAEADDLKLAFFHGMGLWLKGRGGSWYSEGFRVLAPKFRAVLTAYPDFFRSPDAMPQVDTLQAGIYANRFPLGDQVLYTLYNTNPETVSGPVLGLGPGQTATTLYAAQPLSLTLEGERLVADGFFPQEVAAVLVEPER